MKRFFRNEPRAFRIVAASIVAIALGVVIPLYQLRTSRPVAAVEDASSSGPREPLTGELEKGTPKYDTVLPKGKTISDYGGWTRVSPPKRDPVYAYVDKVGTIPINVSQQPLPKEFSDQPDQQIKNLADQYAAKKTVKANGSTVYIGTSGKGPQSAITVKNRLLILIKSQAPLTPQQWQDYVSSLR